MVAFPKKTWLSGVRLRLSDWDRDPSDENPPPILGILAFEAARTMSNLLSLHRSLSDPEVARFRGTTMRSEGVAYLNSTDQILLNRLACAELVDELDHAAAAISRIAGRRLLGWRTRDFQRVYDDVKAGAAEVVAGFAAKDVERKVKRMERYVTSTANLYTEMEVLAELEASEKRLERWRNYSGPMTPGGPPPTPQQQDPPGAELLMRKLAAQRRAVRRLQDESLWGRRYEKVADIMSRAVVTIFARICDLFRVAVTDLPVVVSDRDGRFRFASTRRHHHHLAGVYPGYSSGPLERAPPSVPGNPALFFRSSGPIPRSTPKDESRPWTARALEPPSNTAGAAGMALRYADVVILAERMLFSPEYVGEDAREELYGMLPRGLRAAVRSKLRNRWRADADVVEGGDATMAAGWRDAAGRILAWLAPMAHDTVRWCSERSCERQRLGVPSEEGEGRVLALQTLCFSDREKAEAAIVEVLVGLSCVCRYQHGGCFGGKEEEEFSD